MAQRSSDITDIKAVGRSAEISERQEDEARLSADTVTTDEAARETENIRAQIVETRADMGETIDAIQEKLSLANISEQVSEQVNNALVTAKDTVYEATVGKVVEVMKNTGREISNSSLVATAKDNPLPFVLIGLGAGLLAYQGFSRGRRGSGAGYASPRYLSDRDRGAEGSMSESARGGLRSVTDTVSNAAESTYHGVTEAAGSALSGVRKAAETTYSGAGDLAHRAMEKAGDLGTKAQETYNHMLEERPWAIGAAAMVAGAAIGLALPSTRYEGQIMGEARINLMNKVQDSATDLIDKAKTAANEAGRVITDEAKNLADETLG